MIPNGVFSSTPVDGALLSPDDVDRTLLEDFERGGIHVNDPSAGLNYQNWRMWYDKPSNQIRLATVGGADQQVVLTSSQITELSFSFDQNMRLAVAYVEAGALKFRWFDPIAGSVVTDQILGASSPFVALDDRRDSQLSDSDLILGYVRANNLCYRMQRDRFAVEHIVSALPPGTSQILSLGMSQRNRLQFTVKTSSTI